MVKQNKMEEENKFRKEHQKMQEIRRKYKNLYLNNSVGKELDQCIIPQSEYEHIEKVLLTMEEQTKRIKESPKYSDGIKLLKDIELLNTLRFNMEQAKRLRDILNDDVIMQLRKLKIIKKTIDENKVKIFISNRLIDAIDRNLDNIQDIEELRKLYREISKGLENMNSIRAGGIKTKISRKIYDIQQQNAINKARYEVPDGIKTIIQELAKGEINIEKAKKVIDVYAKNKAKNVNRNKLGFTEEQQKRQLIIKIRSILSEKADEYSIENPEKTLEYLEELSGGEKIMSLNTVVENLIMGKKFGKARKICDKYLPYKDKKDINYQPNINTKNKIRNGEIANVIMNGINNATTVKEERDCIKYIQGMVGSGEIKASEIILGKSKDRTINIKLSDVWENERVGELRR